jgi:hypothetical protein
MWVYWRIAIDPGPTDGIANGVGMILLIVIVVYYFILTAWTWRLLHRNDNYTFEIKLQYASIFGLGILTPIAGLAFIYF